MASKGDPRVLFVMNLVLSFAFSVTVLGGLAFIGTLAFDWTRVAIATLVLMVLSYLVVLS